MHLRPRRAVNLGLAEHPPRPTGSPTAPPKRRWRGSKLQSRGRLDDPSDRTEARRSGSKKRRHDGIRLDAGAMNAGRSNPSGKRSPAAGRGRPFGEPIGFPFVNLARARRPVEGLATRDSNPRHETGVSALPVELVAVRRERIRTSDRRPRPAALPIELHTLVPMTRYTPSQSDMRRTAGKTVPQRQSMMQFIVTKIRMSKLKR